MSMTGRTAEVLNYVRTVGRPVSMDEIREAYPGTRHLVVRGLLANGRLRRVHRGLYEDPALPQLADPAEVAIAALRAAGRGLLREELAAYRLTPETVDEMVKQGVLDRHIITGGPMLFWVATEPLPKARRRLRRVSMSGLVLAMLRASPTVSPDKFRALGVTSDLLYALIAKGKIRRMDDGRFSLAEQQVQITQGRFLIRQSEHEGCQPTDVAVEMLDAA